MKITVLTLMLLSPAVMAFNIQPGEFLGTKISYACPDDLQNHVELAFVDWNHALSGALTVQRVDQNPNLLILEVPDLGSDKNGLIWSEHFLYGDFAIIVFRDGPLYTTLQRELGFALGLYESNDPEATMSAYFDGHQFIDQDDIDGVREIYGLSPLNLDFSLKKSGRVVYVKSFLPKKEVRFVWNDLFGESLGNHLSHRYAKKGVYDIRMVWGGETTGGGIVIQKTVIIK